MLPTIAPLPTQMAPVHWRDAERMGFAAFPVPKEPPPGGAGGAPAVAAVPRGIRAAPMPGSAAAAGADVYRDGSAASALPRPVTRVFQQSFNRSNLTYAVVAKGGAARDAEIIK